MKKLRFLLMCPAEIADSLMLVAVSYTFAGEIAPEKLKGEWTAASAKKRRRYPFHV